MTFSKDDLIEQLADPDFYPLERIVKEVLKDVPCKTVTLNGLLLSDSSAILRHLSWHFSTLLDTIAFTAYEQFGSYLETHHTKEPIIFVLEELEQFALVPGQHLLYTLFEAPSNLHLPVLVIGLTERYDVVSMLEKRVKSRFSQHVLAAAEPKCNFAGYMEAIQAAICPQAMPKTQRDRLLRILEKDSVQAAFQLCFMQSPSIHHALSRLLSLLNRRAPIDEKCIVAALSVGQAPSLSLLLEQATEPQLLILIALFRLSCKAKGQLRPSFDVIMGEISEMLAQADHNHVSAAFSVSRESLLLAWDSLVDAGFVSKSGQSWVSAQMEPCAVMQPLSNLYDSLPVSCPKHLQSLAQLE